MVNIQAFIRAVHWDQLPIARLEHRHQLRHLSLPDARVIDDWQQRQMCRTAVVHLQEEEEDTLPSEQHTATAAGVAEGVNTVPCLGEVVVPSEVGHTRTEDLHAQGPSSSAEEGHQVEAAEDTVLLHIVGDSQLVVLAEVECDTAVVAVVAAYHTNGQVRRLEVVAPQHQVGCSMDDRIALPSVVGLAEQMAQQSAVSVGVAELVVLRGASS